MKSHTKQFVRQFEEQYSNLSELPAIGLAEIPQYTIQYLSSSSFFTNAYYDAGVNTINVPKIDTSTLVGKFHALLLKPDGGIDGVFQHEEHHWYNQRVMSYLDANPYVPLNIVERSALVVTNEMTSQIIGYLKNDVSKEYIKKRFKKAKREVGMNPLYILQFSLYEPLTQKKLYQNRVETDADGNATKQYIDDVKKILTNPDFNIPLFHAYFKYMFTYKGDFLLKDFSKTELLKIYTNILDMSAINISKWVTKKKIIPNMEQDFQKRFR